MTGPSSSVSNAMAMERVPVREYPAPMTLRDLLGSVGTEAAPPIVLTLVR
jgi:hypothetical protein